MEGFRASWHESHRGGAALIQSSHAEIGECQPHLALVYKASDNVDDSFKALSLEKVTQCEFLRDYLLFIFQMLEENNPFI